MKDKEARPVPGRNSRNLPIFEIQADRYQVVVQAGDSNIFAVWQRREFQAGNG